MMTNQCLKKNRNDDVVVEWVTTMMAFLFWRDMNDFGDHNDWYWIDSATTSFFFCSGYFKVLKMLLLGLGRRFCPSLIRFTVGSSFLTE